MDVRPLFEIGILYIWTAAALTVPVFLIVLIVTGFGHRWLAPWARQSLCRWCYCGY